MDFVWILTFSKLFNGVPIDAPTVNVPTTTAAGMPEAGGSRRTRVFFVSAHTTADIQHRPKTGLKRNQETERPRAKGGTLKRESANYRPRMLRQGAADKAFMMRAPLRPPFETHNGA
jgi:hypothetical protein